MRDIVLYGDTLSLSAIGVRLEARPGSRVMRVDPAAPDTAALLRQSRPDVVLFDLAAAQPGPVISLLREVSGLLLIDVDLATHQALVLSGHHPGPLTTDVLIELIQSQPGGDRQAGA